ncbi:MAG: hypothetical protein ACKOFN_10340 [Vulcanococcus sp.]
MSTSLEQAYVAVEQAYAAGDYRTALDMAVALLPQIPSNRDDELQQRLQLLMGHLHLHGLQQPAKAAAAYRAVLIASQDPGYRASAEDGLQQAEPPSASPAFASSGNATAVSDQPATPWLEELRPPAARPPRDPATAAVRAEPTLRSPEPKRQTAPDPYDRGLLTLELPGRPSELDRL